MVINNKFKIWHYYWIGLNEQGMKCSGSSHLHSKKAVVESLESNNIILISIKKRININFMAKPSFSSEMLIEFLRGLKGLMSSGINISEAIKILM